MDGVTISNIAIDGVGSPLFVPWATGRGLMRKARPSADWYPANVVLSNIVATNVETGFADRGHFRGHRIENLTLNNIRWS